MALAFHTHLIYLASQIDEFTSTEEVKLPHSRMSFSMSGLPIAYSVKAKEVKTLTPSRNPFLHHCLHGVHYQHLGAVIPPFHSLHRVPKVFEPLKCVIPCPGKLSANHWASCQSVNNYEMNARDHDFGNELKNGRPSNFPYMFPGQLV